MSSTDLQDFLRLTSDNTEKTYAPSNLSINQLSKCDCIVSMMMSSATLDSIFEVSYHKLSKICLPFNSDMFYEILLSSSDSEDVKYQNALYLLSQRAISYLCNMNSVSLLGTHFHGSRSGSPSLIDTMTQHSLSFSKDISSMANIIELFEEEVRELSDEFGKILQQYKDVPFRDERSTKVETDHSELLREFLVDRIIDEGFNVDTFLLRFLLLISSGRIDHARNVIVELIVTTFQMIPINEIIKTDESSMRNAASLVSALVQLQQLIFLHRHVILQVYNAQSSSTLVKGLYKLFTIDEADGGVLDFVIALTVRIGFTIIFSVTRNYDHLVSLFKSPLRLLQNHPQRRPLDDGKHIDKSNSAEMLKHNDNDSTDTQDVDIDPGYEYYYDLTRQEAVQILSQQQAGRFLVRPHETNADQMFLSFRNMSSATSTSTVTSSGSDSDSLSGNSQSVRHAIIRIETSTESKTHLYRCGKIGPCSSLNELLQAIDKFIGAGLVFRPLRPDELPDELSESLASALESHSNDPRQTRHSPITAHSLALRDPNYDFWLLTHRKIRSKQISNDKTRANSTPAEKMKGTNEGEYLRKLLNEGFDLTNQRDREYMEYDKIEKESHGLAFSYGISAASRASLVHESLFVLSLKFLQKQLASISTDHIRSLLNPSNLLTTNLSPPSSRTILLPSLQRQVALVELISEYILSLIETSDCKVPFSMSAINHLAYGVESYQEKVTASEPAQLRELLTKQSSRGQALPRTNQRIRRSISLQNLSINRYEPLGELLYILLETFSSTLTQLVLHHDDLISSKLLPALAHLMIYSPTNGMTSLIDSNSQDYVLHTLKPSISSISLSAANISYSISNHQDVLKSSTALAEYIILQLFRQIPAKSIRIPAVLGAGGFYSPNCSPNSNSSSTGSHPSSLSALGGSMLALGQESSHSNQFALNGQNMIYEYIIEGLDPTDVVNWLTTDGKYCLKLCFRYGIFDRVMQSFTHSNSNSNNNIQTSSSLNLQNAGAHGPTLLGSSSQLDTGGNTVKFDEVNVPNSDISHDAAVNQEESNNSSQLTLQTNQKKLPTQISELIVLSKYLLTWLVQQRVMVNVVRPPDSSFTTATNYFKYRDTWEVKLAVDTSSYSNNEQIAATKSKLGRQYYSSASSILSSSTNLDSSKQDPNINGILFTIPYNQLMDGQHTDEDYHMLERLWEAFRGDWYLVHTISTSYPAPQRHLWMNGTSESRIDMEFNGTGKQQSGLSDYNQSISRHLYRNCMLGRMRLPYRYIANLHIDLLGLKEVRGRRDHFSFVHVSAHSLEVYCTARLLRSNSSMNMISPGQVSSKPRTTSSSSASVNSTGGGSNQYGANRLELIASQGIVTGSRRADSVKSSAMGGGNSNATEYNYRESVLLKFPLPEDHIVSNKFTSDSTLFPLLVTYPQILVMSIHEKTFFSEKKLGEVELNLSEIHEDKPFRDWLPLTSDKSTTWLINAQVKLSFSLMTIDNNTKASSPMKKKYESCADIFTNQSEGQKTSEVTLERGTTVGEVAEMLNKQFVTPVSYDWSDNTKGKAQFASTVNNGVFAQAEDIF